MSKRCSFLLDENIPYSLLTYLEKKDFSAYHVRKLGKEGIRNGEVYQLAVDLRAWIVTRDRDFLNLVKFLSYDIPGVIVFVTDAELTRIQVVEYFERFLKQCESTLDTKQLICIEDNEVRLLRSE